MRNIYMAGQYRSQVLYPYRNHIYLKYLEGSRQSRPILLADDYLGGLSDVFYHGTIYYSYITTGRRIEVKSIQTADAEYIAPIPEGAIAISPELSVGNGELMLFCVLKMGQENVFRVKADMIYEEKEIMLPEKYMEEPQIRIFEGNGGIVLETAVGGECHYFLYRESCGFVELSASKQQDDLIESIKMQYEELMHTAMEYREEARKWRDKFLAKG